VAIWGYPSTVEDICGLFEKFCKSLLPALPWSDQPLTLESEVIRNNLSGINANGFLTINSQPAVDGAPSSDPAYGWGPKNGFVYQKVSYEVLPPYSSI
jgi:methylenetetrahydrofolate reductase (NADPH)